MNKSKNGYWKHDTPKGPVQIRRLKDQRFHVFFENENLGPYGTPEQAIDDAAGGHTFSPSSGTDLGSLGLSSDIGDWEWIPAAAK